MHARLSLLLTLLPAVLAAQDLVPYQRVAGPLFDLVVFSDSTYGVQLLASPNLRTARRSGGLATSRLSLLSTDIATWTPRVRQLMASPPLTPSPSAGKFAGASLTADRGRSSLTLGYDPLAAFNERFFLVVAELDEKAWRAPLPDSAVSALLTALETASKQSALREASGEALERAMLECELDEQPRLRGRPTLHYPNLHPRKEGRVWAEFVITAEGRVDSTTIQILLSDDPAFETSARSTLRSIRFKPGQKNGTPVRVLAFQQFSFRVEN